MAEIPGSGDGGSEGRPVIRAELIRQLILGKVPESEHPAWFGDKGVRLHSARIEGTLDLEALDYDLPIEIENSVFAGPVILSDARLRRVSFKGAEVPYIAAEGCRIEGYLELFGLEADSINLFNARIDGILGMSHARLNRSDLELPGPALNCEGAEIRDVFLTNGTANGKLSFINSWILGVLACQAASFKNPRGTALDCDAAQIGASVFLSDGFEAVGEVNFVRARIGQSFQCLDASFTASLKPGDISKPAENILHPALNLEAAEIGAALFLCDIWKFKGALFLRDARVNNFADDGTAWPRRGQLILDGFQYNSFTDNFRPGSKRTIRDGRKRRKWLILQPQDDLTRYFKPQPWTQLASVLFREGRNADARYILRKRSAWRLWHQLPRTVRELLEWPMNFLWGILSGFGYSLRRPVILAFVIIVAGGVVFSLARDLGLMRPVSPLIVLDRNRMALVTAPDSYYEEFRPWIYSIEVFMPDISKLHQESNWEPHDAGDVDVDLLRAYPQLRNTPQFLKEYVGCIETGLENGWVKNWFTFQVICGWIFASVFAVGLTEGMRNLIKNPR